MVVKLFRCFQNTVFFLSLSLYRMYNTVMENTVCPYAKECGGCTYMGTEYSLQLQKKKDYVQSLFDHPAEDVIGMENPYHYRHKVYAAFGKNRKGKVIAGMYEEGSHHLIKVPDCLIQNECANRIVSSMVKAANDMRIEPYNEDRRTGILRHAYIRVSHKDNSVLLTVVIAGRQLPGAKKFLQRIRKENPEIKSIVINENSAKTSMVLGKKESVVYGSGTITDTILGTSFRISSKSFYQVNPVQTELLYAKALELAQLDGHTTVLDVCCGIGTISLIAAKQAASVIGVEINPSSIHDAIHNAKTNNIRNARFYCADASKFIDELEEIPDVVFLDPPRSGMGEHFMTCLNTLRPNRIVYISCNPVTQAEDIAHLSGYSVKKIVPVDMFPFSRHVETVCLLSNRFSNADTFVDLSLDMKDYYRIKDEQNKNRSAVDNPGESESADVL